MDPWLMFGLQETHQDSLLSCSRIHAMHEMLVELWMESRYNRDHFLVTPDFILLFLSAVIPFFIYSILSPFMEFSTEFQS